MRDRSFIHRNAQSKAAKADNLRRFGPQDPIIPQEIIKLTLWAYLVNALRVFLKWWKA